MPFSSAAVPTLGWYRAKGHSPRRDWVERHGTIRPMSMQVEMSTSVRRRRRWSRAEKERIVAAAMEPGALASEVARTAGIHLSQLSRWRHELRAMAAGAEAPLSPAMPVAGSEAAAVRTESGAIEIEFANGARMRITGPVDDAVIGAVVAALAKTRQ
jgi:transposase